jgi:prepilin-type N-terminal cleavage/methylation domain-containing protein
VSMRRRAQRAFTLLEMMLAVVLVAMGVSAALLAFSRGIFAANDAADLRTGNALAQAKIEALQNTSFGSLANETRAAVSGFTGFEREVTVTSSPGSTDSNFKQVVVTVYWTLTGELSTALTMYVANTS